MIHRTARERLLSDVKQAPDGVRVLEGIRGHSATIEPSADGPARLVRVSDGSAEVCWAFSTEPDEARPGFYPDDLPFLPQLACEVGWDDETGLVVKWTGQLTESAKVDFRSRIKSFTEVAGARDSPDKPRQLMEALLAPEASNDLAAILARISAFHEEQGWNAGPEKGAGSPFRRLSFRSGPRVRTVTGTPVGVPIVVLQELPS